MLGTVTINDINHALPRVLPMLARHGVNHTAASVANERPTIEWPGVFITEYTNPRRNVLFCPKRNANPFFHYLEAMWIIRGRNDTKFLAHVLPKMADYSDNGETFHGAYGHRLRHWPIEGGGEALDQIEQAIKLLSAKPSTRQVVMSIWNPNEDLGAITKDMPCNDMLMLKIRGGRLNLTVNNRSNDVIFGCYGANVVQFSMLLMYMAARLGVGVGTYTQVSDSFHVYEDTPYWKHFLEVRGGAAAAELDAMGREYDRLGDANLFENNIDVVDEELEDFLASAEESIDMNIQMPNVNGYASTAAHDAACMWNSLRGYRLKDGSATLWADQIRASDWSLACHRWLERRAAKAAA